MTKTKNPDKCLQRLMRFTPQNSGSEILQMAFFEKLEVERRKNHLLPNPHVIPKSAQVSPEKTQGATNSKGIFSGKGPIGLINNICGKIAPNKEPKMAPRRKEEESFPSSFLESSILPRAHLRAFSNAEKMEREAESNQSNGPTEETTKHFGSTSKEDLKEYEGKLVKVIEKLENELIV